MTPLTPILRSTGDLIADRRYAYAAAAFADGDFEAAADLAAQALERAPGFVPALALLGRAKAALGRRGEAVAALSDALAREPDDPLGVRLDLARLGALPIEEAVGQGYLRALFDGYAGTFEKHLVEALHYRGPALIRDAVQRAAALQTRPFRFGRMLDLGCGTGLAGRAFEGLVEVMEGVDISPGMLAVARRTGLYAALHQAEIAAFLRCRGAAFDLVVAADVLVYLARLEEVLAGARRALAPDGLFAFTVQAAEADGVVLGEDARYAHGEAYLRNAAAESGLGVVLFERASTRRDAGRDVPGFVVVLTR